MFEDKQLPKVVIVDDDEITLESLKLCLDGDFETFGVNSGEECLKFLENNTPDLILLDIEMPGLNGYETCELIKKTYNIPIIFISGHDDLEERMIAYNSGGDDFISKPFNLEWVLRKSLRLVNLHIDYKSLKNKQDSINNMAMGFLKNIGETGVLLNFMRSSLNLSNHYSLAKNLIEATKEYGCNCHVQIRYEEEGQAKTITLIQDGFASPLEESVLESSSKLGRIFQFSNRLVVNFDAISILIVNLPTDIDERGKIRDNIAILCESGQAICETINSRKESALRAEALQFAMIKTSDAIERVKSIYKKQQEDAEQSLQKMTDEIEKSYFNLGLTDNQEIRVNNMLRDGTENTLSILKNSEEIEENFNEILNVLNPRNNVSQTDIW